MWSLPGFSVFMEAKRTVGLSCPTDHSTIVCHPAYRLDCPQGQGGHCKVLRTGIMYAGKVALNWISLARFDKEL